MNLRLLLVEDDDGDAHLVQQMLRTSKEPNFEISRVSTIADAQSRLRDSRPDVLLLDMSLPDSRGIETLFAARGAASLIPIIVLTAQDDTQLALQTLEHGAQDYLVKGSFDSDALVRAIRYAISRTRLEQRLAHSEARDRMLVAALEAVGNGVLVTDIESRIEWVNPAFERLTGYSRDEAVGCKAGELMNSGVQDKVFYEYMWRTIRGGKNWSAEMVNRCKDGSLQSEELTIAPVKDDAGKIIHFVGIKHDISERKQVEDRMLRLAQYDALTELPNRTLFSDRMAQGLAIARRDKERMAVVFIDLDKFKPINDTLGHAVGDMLLVEASRRMETCVRESDTLARIGGDEFVALLRAVSQDEDALVVAEKIRSVLARPFLLAGHTLEISASIGIAIYPEHGQEEIELTRNADIAMYQAKQSGRDRVKLFHPSMQGKSS